MQDSQCSRILTLLQDGAVHTVPDILRKCYGRNTASSVRIAARIHELKGRGYDIRTHHIKGSTFAYELKVKTKWKKKR